MERFHIHGYKVSMLLRSVLYNLIYRSNTIPIKILTSYFVDINALILNLIWKSKNLEWPNNTELEKENWILLPDFRTSWWKNRQKQNIIAQKETHTKVNWFLTKEQNQFNRERILFTTYSTGTIGHPHVKISI